MKKINADKLKAGDILAKDIISPKGITILKKGSKLTDRLIDNIKKIGSGYSSPEEGCIFIEEHAKDKNGNTEISLENKEKMEKDIESLEKRFEKVAGYEYMEEIKNAIKNQIIKYYEESGNSGENDK